ncbi:MAG: transporter substrate-binding domain-containing protein [bacterium]|nr:transporter substrate-binding domain-containing protein [bacterium]
MFKKIAVAIVILMTTAFSAVAFENHKRVFHVDLSPFPPMVIERADGSLDGFDVDFMNAIAEELNSSVTYDIVDLEILFRDLKEKRVDAAIAGLTITEEREKQFDFSHHYFDSGLRIAVPEKKANQWAFFSALTQSVTSPEVSKGLCLLFLLVIVFGHIYWFVERKNEAIDTRYFPGIFEAMYFTVVTAATVGYGDISPKTMRGRLTAVTIILVGIGVFGIFSAQLTSALTVQKIEYDISTVNKLHGKRVATVRGTTSVDSLKSLGAEVVSVTKIEDAYTLLDAGKVKAVVYDAPAIQNYTRTDGAGKIVTVGDMFDLQYYGVAFPEGSPLREEVNRAILKLKKNGVYDKLYKKWFGNT